MYVVITGASRGIGKALAYKYAESGYDLILTCEKNIELLQSLEKEIKSKFPRQVYVKDGLLEVRDVKDDIYLLINNAAKCDYSLLQDISYDRYKELIYANLDYTFLTTQLVCKQMIKNKQGIIINISSVWGEIGAAMETIYSMTKGGINAFTKALAKELKDSNVDVLAFALGVVDTEMNEHLSNEERQNLLKTLDGGRMFTATEIADKIYSVVKDRCYKSGEIVEINNGLV